MVEAKFALSDTVVLSTTIRIGDADYGTSVVVPAGTALLVVDRNFVPDYRERSYTSWSGFWCYKLQIAIGCAFIEHWTDEKNLALPKPGA